MKYNFLNDERLNNRYETVEKNIRAESNSFYDSYLDMLECLIKKIIEEQSFDITQRTAGEILRCKTFKDFLENKLHFGTTNVLIDFVSKCNKHKHEKEKTVGIETVISYLREFFELFNKYSEYNLEETLTFDAAYFHQIFGDTKRQNVNLNKKVHRLLDDLKDAYEANKLSEENMERMRKILDDKEDILLSIEDQNRNLLEKLDELKDIKINSMEIKLNRTIELLLDLKEDILINKTLSQAVGHSIMGEDFDEFIKDELGKENGK